MRLKGKVAIVTGGGGGGIGEATCLLLAKEGAVVAVGDVASEAGMATASNIARLGGEATYGTLDATDASSVEAFVARVVREYRHVDILVNNVGGVITRSNVLDCSEVDWDKTFTWNVKSVFFMSRAVLPSMIANRSGSIINVSSAAALVGRKNLVAYSAAKGALIALTRAMANDHGKDGIRTNCVCPGPTATAHFLRNLAMAPDPEARRRAREQESPLGKLGQPLDIAEAIVFLASDQGGWMTGAVLTVDGGSTAI